MAPFKPQNMSNNAAVTVEGGVGGEIGRAQALQARAAGLAPSVHMNPVLLKPQSDIGAQVVVQGRVRGNAKARDYHALKPELLAAVLESFNLLGRSADLVLVEGAGSPAEVNLRDGDIANMGFAEAADVPVVLAADIDRGGVIAQLVGTHALMTEAERTRVKGYVINKFRGDATLFSDGMDIISARTRWPTMGLVPYFTDARLLPAEDAMALDTPAATRTGPHIGTRADTIRIAVPRISRIANFDDLDPLAAEPDVSLSIVEAGRPLPLDADVIVLPGSKSTLSDLADLRTQGWDIDVLAHHRRGGLVIGLCGGYQMLGRTVADPDGIEGAPGEVAGLGLLEVDTVIGGDKSLVAARGRALPGGEPIAGYEMHMGRTTGADTARPWLELQDGRKDGAISADGRVMACYVHGLFAADVFRHAFLADLRDGRAGALAYETQVEAVLDRLAAHLETHLDIEALLAAAG